MATTTNLTTLKINYLTQAQYDTALANNQIEENEIYLTPQSGSTVETDPIFSASAGTSASAVGTTASGGSATTWSRSDHVHNITSSTITSALGYTPYNSTNPNGYVTTDEKLALTGATSGSSYDIIVGDGTTAAIRQYDANSGFTYTGTVGQGSGSPAGTVTLTLGNSRATETPGNRRGYIRVYGSGTCGTTIQAGTPSSANTVTLPTSNGTLVLSSEALLVSGGTMTGQLLTSFNSSVAMGSFLATATTVPNLANEIRFSSGCTGSVNIGTAYTKGSVTIPTGWYNFFYSPHRSGGVNGAASGDNCNYGTILLSGMTISGLYRIRVQGTSDYVAELEKVCTSSTPYITAQGTTGSTWTYRKWSDGYQECWYHGSITFETAGSALQNWYRSVQTISLPTATGFTAFADTATVIGNGAYNAHIFTAAGLVKTSGTEIEVQLLGGSAIAANVTVTQCNIYVAGYAR